MQHPINACPANGEQPGSGPLKAVDRLLAALADPGHRFTVEQTVYLMSLAARWARQDVLTSLGEAYQQGVADERQRMTDLTLDALRAGTRAPAFSERALRMEGYRQRARREADIAAGHPWRGDHPGGPVPVWEMPERGARAEALERSLARPPQVRR